MGSIELANANQIPRCSFLINRSIVKLSHAELDLCLLSVAYLSFPEFSVSTSQDQIHKDLLQGRYAFYEYAVTCWAFHITSWEPDEQTIREEKELIDELSETFEGFLAEHHRDVGTKASISKKMHDHLKPFQHCEYYDQLTEAVVFARKQTSVEPSRETDIKRLDFADVISVSRSSLETLVDSTNISPDKLAEVKIYYGPNLFKCPKVYCQHFFKGFGTKDGRDTHLKRHEEAYICTFEGCPVATFGCVSRKELERHLLESHGFVKEADGFPDLPDPNDEQTVMAPGQKHPAKHQCTRCPKRYTRLHNLRSHLQLHKDEHALRCKYCETPFRRLYDKLEHENTCLSKSFNAN